MVEYVVFSSGGMPQIFASKKEAEAVASKAGSTVARRMLANDGRTPGRWGVSRYSDAKKNIFIGREIPGAGNYDRTNDPICSFDSPFYANSDSHKKLQENQICDAKLMTMAPQFFEYIAKKAAEGDEEAKKIVEQTKVYL